jgi:hypothetical protein
MNLVVGLFQGFAYQSHGETLSFWIYDLRYLLDSGFTGKEKKSLVNDGQFFFNRIWEVSNGLGLFYK